MIQGATVVHHVPGRVRVRIPHARHNAALLTQIRDFVCDLHGVRQVDINAYTGSIVVHYAPEAEQDLRRLLPGDGGGEIGEIEAEAEFLAAHSKTALAIFNFFKGLDDGVRQATGNAVDLKVLAPAALALWAFFKAGSEISTPLWVTLAIFSINAFVTLHSTTSAQA